MQLNWKRLNRKIHYWGAIICAIPLMVVTVTGILLLLKKEFDWIQPPTIKGQGHVPTLSFDEILNNLSDVTEVSVNDWSQITRIDVQPRKGLLKIGTLGNWEVQMDHQTGDILQVAYRRSGVIESIHDGSFFHQLAKLWLFLPAAIILFVLWVTGIYLFAITELSKYRSRIKQQQIPHTN